MNLKQKMLKHLLKSSLKFIMNMMMWSLMKNHLLKHALMILHKQ